MLNDFEVINTPSRKVGLDILSFPQPAIRLNKIVIGVVKEAFIVVAPVKNQNIFRQRKCVLGSPFWVSQGY